MGRLLILPARALPIRAHYKRPLMPPSSSALHRLISDVVLVVWSTTVFLTTVRPILQEVQKAGARALESQPDRADRTITLLANNNLGRALVGRVGVIDFVPINKQDQIRILLNGAGFAQITHDRTLVGTLLQTAVKL